jgi:hypothetical protein
LEEALNALPIPSLALEVHRADNPGAPGALIDLFVIILDSTIKNP